MPVLEDLRDLGDAAELLADARRECKPVSADNPIWLFLHDAQKHVLAQMKAVTIDILHPPSEVGQ